MALVCGAGNAEVELTPCLENKHPVNNVPRGFMLQLNDDSTARDAVAGRSPQAGGKGGSVGGVSTAHHLETSGSHRPVCLTYQEMDAHFAQLIYVEQILPI